MKQTFFLAPVGRSLGLTTVALGTLQALDRRGVKVGFFKPFNQRATDQEERSVHFIRAITHLRPAEPIPFGQAMRLISEGRLDELLGDVIARFEESTAESELVIVEGLAPTESEGEVSALNQALLTALGARLLIVTSAQGKDPGQIDEAIEYGAKIYGGLDRLAGVVVNRCPSADFAKTYRQASRVVGRRAELLAAIPRNDALLLPRAIDLQRHLQAEVLHGGEMASRRVKSMSLLARTVPNLLHTLTPGSMLVTPADRTDIILAVAMGALNRVPLAGLILTGDTEIDKRIIDFCQPAFDTGLPLLRVTTNSYTTATALYELSPEVPADDLERIRQAMEFVAQFVDVDWFISQSQKPLEIRLSPAAFLHRLTEKARAARKRIVLPEGNEPRTIKAAAICTRRGIARCVLLANPADVQTVAKSQDVTLPPDLEIIEPGKLRANYATPLFEARRNKGLSREMAESQLEDNVVLGTMMLYLGEVDGLVSGAVHSTANTIRPALQVIKTKPGAKTVSSIFFMCLPEQVLVYGDCAVVPDPDVETLADIAIQSADSAAAFGIEPRVAMISYSTGTSGSGVDVEKVRAATELAKKLRPDLLLDGPLQYDAAFIPEVARAKAPDSPVAGRATVFIFPDLNTGNTTYKAVQRSANVVSIGPMLQGLRRPVNDLSRGALVDDIVYTIALTAIQATQD
ncbi:MAG: phosphate acetyltransferase [Verrucomicrobia bacterium]|nr:phosphate acetyltransferase [Verrucomicrobiota bacterium]